MQRGFGEILWSSFKKVHAISLAVGGTLLAIGVYLFTFSDNLSLRIFVIVIISIMTLMVMAILTLFNAAYDLHTTGSGSLPKVIQGIDPFPGYAGAVVCLLEPSSLFNFGIMASFYRVEEQGLERLIGVGSVVNIQGDGKIQVEMTRASEGHDEFIGKLRSNDAAALRSTLVKPNVPQRLGLGWSEENQ